MRVSRWMLLPTLGVIAACGAPPSEVIDPTADSSTTSGITDPPVGTTLPIDTDGGSQGGTTLDLTDGGMDTTVGASTTDRPGSTTDGDTTTDDGGTTDASTTSSESSTGTPIPECMIDDECGSNQICELGSGTCVDACGGLWGMGNYGPCLDALGGFEVGLNCGAGNLCIYGEYPIPGTTCSTQGCTDACDCPAPPMDGNAVVTCADITAGDTDPDCYLSCANGETCPSGMTCFAGPAASYCISEVADVPMWGNCGNLQAECLPGSTCVIENGYTACIALCPGGVGDCDAAPAGAQPEECNGVIFPPNGADCILPCTIDADCPGVMECYDDPNVTGTDSLCMWPMEWLIPGGTCCNAGAMMGCSVPAIETCTCAVDAFCCDTQWDMMCVDTATAQCSMECP